MQVWRLCRSRLVLGVFLFAARPRTVQPQSVDASAPRTGVPCFDSIPATAFTRVAVYGTLKFSRSPSVEVRTSAEILLQDVAMQVRKLLGAEQGTSLPRGEPAVNWRSLGSPLGVTVYRNGRIAHHVPPDRADTSAASMIAKALDLATPEVPLFIWGADSLRDSVSFDIELAWPTLTREGNRTAPKFTSAAIMLFSLSLPWEHQTTAYPSNRGPRYPDGPRSARYEGVVNMQFLVDTSGRVVPSSMKALWPDTLPELQGEPRRHYDAFVAAVRDALEPMRFYPAEVGGCKTPQLVVMPFEFRLSR